MKRIMCVFIKSSAETNRMKEEQQEEQREEEALVTELKLQLDDETLKLDQKLHVLSVGLNSETLRCLVVLMS